MNLDILENLNTEQKEAVITTEGPVLILAGAGSGKTKALTHRIAYLICEKKIHPENILAVTFTNKAAEEMASRVTKLLGISNSKFQISKLPWLGTFHSICAKILRFNIQNLDYTRSFNIYDSDDSLSAVKHAMDVVGIDKKQYNPRVIRNYISGAKNELLNPQNYAKFSKGHFGEIVLKIYQQYQKDLKIANALDFDDLLFKTVELFEKFPAVLARYQDQFRYILIDEYQDTNFAQYRFSTLLAKKYQNICVVGDDFQCLSGKTKVLTSEGQKEIRLIKPKDKVICANGYGTTTKSEVSKVFKRNFKGKVWQIETKSGHMIEASSEHIFFSKWKLIKDSFFVYLMFRRDKGYRIGFTKSIRYGKKGHETAHGLQVRANQEKADRMWILKICKNLSEAKYYEAFFSSYYGIPTSIFFNQGRTMQIRQEHIDMLFKNIDTKKRAKNLLEDLDLKWDFPHHRPQAVTLEFTQKYQGRQFITLNMFGEDRLGQQRPWHAHRVRITTTDPRLREKFENMGFATRMDKRSWRIETSRKDYSEALVLAEKLAGINSLDIIKSARLTDSKTSFDFMPVSNLRPGMVIPVLRNGKIVEDEIIGINCRMTNEVLYDLDIENLHNYIAEGVVVHNSIYGFRGANFKNILDFEKDYPKAKIIKMEQNYRSTKKIIASAQCVIEKNCVRSKKTLWTDNEDGIAPTVFEARSEKEEAEFILDEVEALKMLGGYNQFVILYRTNAQSRIFEEALMQKGIPYRLIGALRFYERREIKDILAYLKLILNPTDRVAQKRIINVPPRGIGEKSQIDKNNPKVLKFLEMIEELRQTSKKIKVSELIDLVALKSTYKNWILDGTEEGEGRWENIEELKSVAASAENLESFLEQVTLVSDIDNLDRSTDAITLMTLHNAKGLEFPIVFMVGMEEGLFPHANSLMEPAELEEERRLCYVGITRARKRLYFSYACSRLLYGSIQANMPSRFLSEISEELLERI
ncbi:MAG: UvrD-helicase domain-containing protein [Patescibacteria group bacterium]|nr:UvrD-helicase domain-containing protein [Patescibacteria group bacterium]